MSYSIVEGDLERDMELTALLNGEAQSLVGALSIQLRWKKPDGTVSLVDLTAVSLAAGTVKRVWVAGDTDQVGTHYGQLVVQHANGETQTFPNDGSYAIWNVYPQLQ